MTLSRKFRQTATGIVALGAVALGGSALADAATNGSSSSTTPGASGAQQPSAATKADPTRPGGHVGANGKTEQALSDDVATKVKAAALAKIPGGTVQRVETDVDHGSPYEAHVTKADGTEVEVLVDDGFNVTAVNTMQHR